MIGALTRLGLLLPFALVVACGSPKPAEEPSGAFVAGFRVMKYVPDAPDASAATAPQATPAPPPRPAVVSRPPAARGRLAAVNEQGSFLDALGLQLVVPPTSSTRRMEKVAAGGHAPAPPSSVLLDPLLDDALSGAEDMLRDDWAWDHRKTPPTAFALPAENNAFDVVRYAYSHGDTKIEIAQTNDVIAFRFRGLPVDRTLPVERQAEAVANMVFRAPTWRPLPFAFGPPKHAGEGFASVRVAPPQELPVWHEVLTFWTDGVDVGFVTLKSDGFINDEIPSASPEANAHWFARFPKQEHAKPAHAKQAHAKR